MHRIKCKCTKCNKINFEQNIVHDRSRAADVRLNLYVKKRYIYLDEKKKWNNIHMVDAQFVNIDRCSNKFLFFIFVLEKL